MFNPNSKWPHKLERKAIVLLWTMKHLNELMEAGMLEGPHKFKLSKKARVALGELPEGWEPEEEELFTTLRVLGVIE